MKIILFGAGNTGKIALHFLGYDRVECFVDNRRFGEREEGKAIVAFSELPEIMKDEDIIVITSEKYNKDMEKQLIEMKFTRYFVFHEDDIKKIEVFFPFYMLYGKSISLNYTQILCNYKIKQYNQIVVVGCNPFIHYFLLELAIQGSLDSIKGIVGTLPENTFAFGIPCIKLEDVWDSIDCLIINKKRNESNIREIIEEKKHFFKVIDIYNVDWFEKSFYHPEIKKYKDIHKGKRAFIIGNGPSLRIEDLDVLYKYNEICIAVNKIYYIYNKTAWRANYVAMTDFDVISEVSKDIPNIEGEVFIGDIFCRDTKIERTSNLNYVHFIIQEYYPNFPGFSDELAYGVYLGNSILYDIGFQLAAYMGIEKMYLLGADHTVVGHVTDQRNHFISNYFSEREYKRYKFRVFERDKVTKAFEKAEIYSRTHGFRIYNATRGGELEVFERVDFDSLF